MRKHVRRAPKPRRLDPDLVKTFRQIRADAFTCAQQALTVARKRLRIEADPLRAMLAHGITLSDEPTDLALAGLIAGGRGYVARVTVRDDEDADISHLGTFTDKWERHAIDRVKAGIISEREARQVCRYFVPEYAKSAGPDAEVHKHARQDWRRAEDYNTGWWMVGVVVSIHAARVPGLRLAHASLWGMESDGGRDYFAETAEELIRETLPEAHKHVATIARNLSTLAREHGGRHGR